MPQFGKIIRQISPKPLENHPNYGWKKAAKPPRLTGIRQSEGVNWRKNLSRIFEKGRCWSSTHFWGRLSSQNTWQKVNVKPNTVTASHFILFPTWNEGNLSILLKSASKEGARRYARPDLRYSRFSPPQFCFSLNSSQTSHPRKTISHVFSPAFSVCQFG